MTDMRSSAIFFSRHTYTSTLNSAWYLQQKKKKVILDTKTFQCWKSSGWHTFPYLAINPVQIHSLFNRLLLKDHFRCKKGGRYPWKSRQGDICEKKFSRYSNFPLWPVHWDRTITAMLLLKTPHNFSLVLTMLFVVIWQTVAQWKMYSISCQRRCCF